jgi:hypothetical protein
VHLLLLDLDLHILVASQNALALDFDLDVVDVPVEALTLALDLHVFLRLQITCAVTGSAIGCSLAGDLYLFCVMSDEAMFPEDTDAWDESLTTAQPLLLPTPCRSAHLLLQGQLEP